MLARLQINASPCVGIFCATNDEFCVLPRDVPKKVARKIAKTLGVEVIQTNIAGSPLVGALLAMNSHGAVVTHLADEDELAELREHLRVETVHTTLNALGNNVLANDYGALVHEHFEEATLLTITKTLGVRVAAKGAVAGVRTVGTVCVATNKGVLCHPETSDEELALLEDLFRVPAMRGTVNFGMPYVGAGAVANTKGALAGPRTTGIELGRLEDALGFL
jgi:translation initiation factor 6